jgi:transcriptional antiterminator RfaH
MDIRSKPELYKWYPVYTHPRAEKKAYQALLNKGIETYLPLRRQLRQWSDRKKWVDEPLIRSYLFVRIAEHQQSEVLMTAGITRFIYFGGKVTSMPDRQIEDLKLLMTSAVELEITEDNLLPGEKIILKAGPLKGMTGEIISYRSQKQLALRLENLGCSIIIHVAATLIDRF